MRTVGFPQSTIVNNITSFKILLYDIFIETDLVLMCTISRQDECTERGSWETNRTSRGNLLETERDGQGMYKD